MTRITICDYPQARYLTDNIAKEKSMPRVNFKDIESSNGGSGFKELTPGTYVCAIQKVQTTWYSNFERKELTSDETSRARFVVDIVDGEFAGEFSRDYYDKEDKDWMHAFFLDWSEEKLGRCKRVLECITASNPGFDAMAAFGADQWTMFIGKRLMITFNGYERLLDTGDERLNARIPDNPKVYAVGCKPEEIDAPRVKRAKENGGEWMDYADYLTAKRAEAQTAPVVAYADESIPF